MNNATRVLVVDDQEDVAVMLGDAIEMIGLRSYIAFDATTALELAETFAPDVALLDLGLPDLDGCELGRRLRARHGKQLFLVAVTAWSDEAHRAAAAAAGFHAYLVKPVKIADIQRVVRDLLEGAKRPVSQPASEPSSVPRSPTVPCERAALVACKD